MSFSLIIMGMWNLMTHGGRNNNKIHFIRNQNFYMTFYILPCSPIGFSQIIDSWGIVESGTNLSLKSGAIQVESTKCCLQRAQFNSPVPCGIHYPGEKYSKATTTETKSRLYSISSNLICCPFQINFFSPCHNSEPL